MKLRRAFIVLLSLLLIANVAVAQDANQQLNDQFYEAVRKGDLAAVTSLLDKGVDVNAKFRYGATALFKAAERGHTEIVKLLLARGADVTIRDTFYRANAMYWALSNNHVEVVRALLEKDGSSVNEVLMKGVREGNASLVEAALAKGGAKPETLTAALAFATDDKDKAAIADMLKKAGAQPPMEIEAAILQSYVGRYKPEQGSELAITLKDGKLFATLPNQLPIAMMATDKTAFRPIAFEGLVITFTVTGEKVASLIRKEGPNSTMYKKVEETK